MKVIFFGTPQFAVSTLLSLLGDPAFTVLGVVTQPDKRRERGNQLTPSPVKTIAEAHQLRVWQPERVKKDTEVLTQLQQAQADVFVVVAYGQILSPEILAMPRLGCINVHGSILPKYRGAAPIQWCIYHGESSTGITTMLMDAGMDTGPMLLKATTAIDPWDNAQDLADKLAVIGAQLLLETLLKLEHQEIQPIPQDDANATYAPLIKKPDYQLDWQKSAIALHNQVRGFFPNCATTFRTQALKITSTAPLNPDFWTDMPANLIEINQSFSNLSIAHTPGEVVSIVKNLGPIIQTGAGLLLLQQVQLAGKRPQSGADFANGTRLAVGEVLGA
jgi:methionyl-tRNA formyltransferase